MTLLGLVRSLGFMNIRDKQSLIAAMAEGLSPTFLPFWGHTPGEAPVGKWVLSQWWPCTFTVDGATYQSAEHWMMAGKARLFDDSEMLERILVAETPADAKKLGRQVRDFETAAWNAVSFELVVEGNVHKFGQDPLKRTFLLGTGDAVLVEAAPRDVIWGIGYGPNNPKVEHPGEWRGRNLLGFALMEARAQLSADTLP